ncbi:MAG: enoyl-CoA hydratase-related protein [Verrucomicrobiales bacterium]
MDDAGIAQLIFDRPDSPANIFDKDTLDQLSQALDQIEKIKSIQHLVFGSAKPGIFMAGADIKSIARATPAELEAFLEQGQNLFERIAAQPCGTAAAIHGAPWPAMCGSPARIPSPRSACRKRNSGSFLPGVGRLVFQN